MKRPDIVEVIGRYTELHRDNRMFVGECPFCQLQARSLIINPDRQAWNCLVCSIGGDAFSFVMRKEEIGFHEAAQRLGVIDDEGECYAAD